MLKIIGIGDNVVDKYLDSGVMYPGGNAVNVPVLAARLGAKAAYIGIVGTDHAGRLMREVMEKEGVDLSRLKVKEGDNGFALVKLVDGDRVFLPGGGGVSRQMPLAEGDLDFAKNYDLIHSSCYSYLEGKLPEMKASGVPVGYDYSDHWRDDYVDDTIEYVDFAYLSGSDVPLDDIKDYIAELLARGPKMVLVTRGKHGAICSEGSGFVEQPIVDAEVVDTMGAGDAFIAGFLVARYAGADLAGQMLAGARSAAANCGRKGAFGYETAMAPEDFPPDSSRT